MLKVFHIIVSDNLASGLLATKGLDVVNVPLASG
jgi:hypothetical protein